MNRSLIYLLAFCLLMSLGCSSPRFNLIFIDQDGDDIDFKPNYQGQKSKVKVWDTEKEEYVPVSYFQFKFSPPKWGRVVELSQKKKTGTLTVITVYNNEFDDPIRYSVVPELRRKAPYK